MRKIYFLLAAFVCSYLSQAQTTPSINFSFTVEQSANKVIFANTSERLGDGVKKAFWSLGDGVRLGTAANEGLTYYYSTAGTYQVCLNIYRYPANTHDSVLIGSICKSVVLQGSCTADFQWRDSVVSQNHFTVFMGFGHNTAGKVIKQVCWKFGDGTDTCINVNANTPSVAYQLVAHKYTKSGSYNACLKITFDGGCVAEKCGAVNVSVSPVIDSCAAHYTTQPVTATSLGRKFIAQPWHNKQKKALRICWSFGDGKDTCISYTSAYSGDYSVEHTFAKAGEYEACMSIKYDGGCESRFCNKIKLEQPTPPVTCEASLHEVATNLTTLERRFYVGLQANKTAEKICWKFGDGTDTCIAFSNPIDPQQLLVSHRYAAPGNYTVCIRLVYAGGCVVERCKQVEIRMPQNNICGGYITDSVFAANSIRFRATSIHNPNDDVAGYLWTFGDGISANEQQVSHTYSAPGKYAVCVSMKTVSGCETKICKSVIIAGEVKPQLVLTPNPVVSTLTATFQSVLQQTVNVRIYNGNGLLLKTYSRNAVAGSNAWNFDLSGLQTGVYTMIVQSPNQFATGIFFKQ